MASEIEIRNAIRSAIAAAAPAAKALARDLLNVREGGWLGVLHDAGGRVRGWMVTQSGASLVEARHGGAEYALHFDVWQFFQYRTGENSSNSEDEFSAEREAVMAVFANPAALPAILAECTPLDFPPGSIGPFLAENVKGIVHLAKGRLSVRKVTGC